MGKHSNYNIYNWLIDFVCKHWDAVVNVTGTGRVTLCVQGIGPVWSGFANRLDQGGACFSKKPVTSAIAQLVNNGITHIRQAKKGNYLILPNAPKDTVKAVLMAITPCLPATATKVSSDYVDAYLTDYQPQQVIAKAKASSKPVDNVTAIPKAAMPVIIAPMSNKRTQADTDALRAASGLTLQPVNVPVGLKASKDKKAKLDKPKATTGKGKGKKSGKSTKK